MKITLEKILLDKVERNFEDDVKKYISKQYFRLFILIIILLVISTVFSTLLIVNVIDSQSNKYSYMKNQLINDYYKPENLDKAMKNVLKESYDKKNREINFDNYVLSLVTKDLDNYEESRWKGYTSFFSKELVKKFDDLDKKEQDNIKCEKVNEKLYKISFQGFKSGITAKNIKSHIDEIKKYKNIVLDLRDNGGGDEIEAKRIADIFLDKEFIVVKNRNSNQENTLKTSDSLKLDLDNLFILTNEETASASEVLIMTLKENLNNVKVIGTKTYGKGIGSRGHKFSDGSEFNYLSFYWFSPKGNSIHNKGIVPDIIENDENKLMDIVLKNIK